MKIHHSYLFVALILSLAGCEKDPVPGHDAGVDAGGPENTEASCSDGMDNDGDGLYDCADPGCLGLAVCQETACANGVDDDGDGDVDCADADCQGTAACAENTAAACQNGADDDGDGDTDCDDADCQAFVFCAPHETACEDGQDNDGDGDTDCDDADCAPLAVCGGFCYPVEFASPATWGLAITEQNDDEDPATDCVQYTVRVGAAAPVAGTEICLYLDTVSNLVGCADPAEANPVEFPAVSFCQGAHSLFAQVRQDQETCTSERIDLVAYLDPTCAVTLPAGLSTDPASPTPINVAATDVEITTTGARAELWVNGGYVGLADAASGVVAFPATSLGADGPVTFLARCHNPGTGNGETDSPTYHLSKDTEAPDLSITAPADGAAFGAGDCPITVTVTGVEAGREVCAAFQGQAPAAGGCATATGPSQSIDLEVACVDGEDLALEAVTDDAHGNVATATVIVTVDTGLPTVVLQSPEHGRVYAKADDTVDASTPAFELAIVACTNGAYNPGNVTLTVDANPITAITPVVEAASCNGLSHRIRWSAPFAFAQLSSGLQTPHTVAVTVSDGLNVGSAAVSFHNDTLAPVIEVECATCRPTGTFFQPSQDQCAGPPFTVEAVARVYGLESARDLQLDVTSGGVPVGASPYLVPSGDSLSYDARFAGTCGVELTVGQNTLAYSATDAAGNVGTAQRIVAYGDLNVTSPAQGAVLGPADDCDAGAAYGIPVEVALDPASYPDGTLVQVTVASAAGGWSQTTAAWASDCSTQGATCTHTFCVSVPAGTVEQTDIQASGVRGGVTVPGGPTGITVDVSAPPVATGLARTITSRRAAEVELTWTAASDPQTGTLVEWDVRCVVDGTISLATWDGARQFALEPAPVASGSQSMRIAEDVSGRKIRAGHAYSCGLRGRNAVGLWSDVAVFPEVAAADVGFEALGDPIEGYARNDWFYWYFNAVAPAGDWNGDGYDDLLLGYGIGQWSYKAQGHAAAVFLGGPGGPTEANRVELTCADDTFGGAMAGLGDFDGAVFHATNDPQRYPDLAVGSTDQDKVYVFRGRGAPPATLDCAQADLVISGPVGSCFGAAVAAVGDVDGDGLRDLAIGAPCDAAYDGAIYLVFGRAEASYPTIIDLEAGTNADGAIRIAGPLEGYAGVSATGADLDLDGRFDVIVSAPSAGTNTRGQVGVLRGFVPDKTPDTVTEVAWADLDQIIGFSGAYANWPLYGYPSLSALDFDGDGCLDLLVPAGGANVGTTVAHAGDVLIYPGGNDGFGCTGTLASAYSAFIHGTALHDLAGVPLAVNLDLAASTPVPWRVNGLLTSASDGAVLAGAAQYSRFTDAQVGPGYAFLAWAGWTGGIATTAADVVFAPPPGAVAHYWVNYVGDLDGDGYVDLAIGDSDWATTSRVMFFH